MADLNIRITVDNTDANRKLVETDKALAGIDASAATATKATGALETSLGKVAAVTTGIAALKVGFEGIAKVGGASVASFSAQENALSKLTAALKAQGQATPQVIAQYGALASEFQNTTVFADELITEMQALLVQIGNVMPRDMGRALKAATDLSAGFGVDLRTATMLVGKAFAGETGTLARYGIVIDQTRLKTEGATVVMEAINQKFGGQAQAQLNTYTGKTALLGNKMGDLREQIGALIVDGLTPLLKLFLSMPTWMQKSVLILGTLAVTLGPIAYGFASIASAVGPLIPIGSALTFAVGIVSGAWTSLWSVLSGSVIPILGAVGVAIGTVLAFFPILQMAIDAVRNVWTHWDQIKPIVISLYNTIKMYLVDQFNAVVESVRQKVDAVTGFFRDMYIKVVGQSFVPDMIRGIGAEFAKLSGVMVTPAANATGQVSGLFQNLALGVANGLASGGVSGALGAVKSFATGAVSSLLGMVPVVGPFLSQFAGPIIAGIGKIGAVFKRVFMNETKDAILDAFGSYDALRAKLGVLGEEGERMWIRLTQQTGKNDLESALAQIEAIKKALAQVPKPDAPWEDWPPPPEVPDYGGSNGSEAHSGGLVAHRGGFIGPHGLARYHSGGLMPDERVIIGQTGEGILNRRAMAHMGATELHARNRGAAPSGGIAVTFNVDGYIDSPQAQERLVRLTSDGILRAIELQRRAS